LVKIHILSAIKKNVVTNVNAHILKGIIVVATPLRRSVRMTLTLSKWGLGSPSKLPKTQNSIVGDKTPCL
jgi:hypothetical protein